MEYLLLCFWETVLKKIINWMVSENHVGIPVDAYSKGQTHHLSGLQVVCLPGGSSGRLVVCLR